MSTIRKKSPFERIKESIEEIDCNFLAGHGIIWDEERDLEFLHAVYCWISLQRWIVKYLKIRQKMRVTEIATFCNVSRNTIYNWENSETPDHSKGPILLQTIIKARTRFKEDFISREPNPDTLHLWGLASLVEYSSKKWFGDQPRPRKRVEPEYLTFFAYLRKLGYILDKKAVSLTSFDISETLKNCKAVSGLTTEEVADVLSDWLKPFAAVYLLESSLFDERILLTSFSC